MATSSIYKHVNIRTKARGKKLIRALEGSAGKKSRPVELTRKVTFPTDDQVKKMFR